ncbi:Transcription factor Pur-alpha [Musa troglodytarum]|uniref:Transcription factor Pur-alpha n=1 Tax=Musa troglodytarum TaxID=320322 RepID=A0A9E7FM70_9LILI|nr:Transcription factor Pur-alpha [Musa troglodytarum]
MERGSGGNDVELLCKTLQFEHKLFYFDLKENPRGRYLKISEKTSATRSTIIVPVGGIVWFVGLFNYYVNTDELDAFSMELKLDTKVFYFDVGENKRGRFLKVSEASVSRNRSTIIVPAGSSGEEGWIAFRNILHEINEEASRLFIVSNQQHMEPAEHLPGLSDDDEIESLGMPKVIRADQKRFFFDLGSNNRGHYLRISEVSGSDRSSIILPLSGLKHFHDTIGHFVEVTKDRTGGKPAVNVRTLEPVQR